LVVNTLSGILETLTALAILTAIGPHIWQGIVLMSKRATNPAGTVTRFA
jgi:hypothetical protein